MAKPPQLLGALAVALGLVAAILGATRDGEILVPPPETISQIFMKQLQSNRFDRALPFLSEELKKTLTADDLESFRSDWEDRNGRIEDVHGGGSEMNDDHAIATAVVKTDRGDCAVPFKLIREEYEWKIAELPQTKD